MHRGEGESQNQLAVCILLPLPSILPHITDEHLFSRTKQKKRENTSSVSQQQSRTEGQKQNDDEYVREFLLSFFPSCLEFQIRKLDVITIVPTPILVSTTE